ncbi:coiled-coil domain-containing protein 80 [Engraulis encrasicolus]|uniref:coiled-coil domain-containing protein 80 n=1 Tax=Engraulis encrasicolus TaxID=184585 RepID=UPI002FCFEA8C
MECILYTMLLYFSVMLAAVAVSVSEVSVQSNAQFQGGMHSQAYRKRSHSPHSDTVIKRHIESIAQLAGQLAAPPTTTAAHSGEFINSQEKMNPDQLGTARTIKRTQRSRRLPQPKKVVHSAAAAAHLDHSSALQTGHSSSSPLLHLNTNTSTTSSIMLARFSGRNRALVISAPHKSDRSYQQLLKLMKKHAYCEMAERDMLQIVIFHQGGGGGGGGDGGGGVVGEMEGKIRHITKQGFIIEEPLDADTMHRLVGVLKLEAGKFEMVLLRKTLQVEARFPYPVRLEAVYEAVDQIPVRRLERLRQKGFVQKCKEAGMEGQVVKTAVLVPKLPETQVSSQADNRKDVVRPTAVSIMRQDTGQGVNVKVTTFPSTTTSTTSSPPGTTTTTTTTTTFTTSVTTPKMGPTQGHSAPHTAATADPFYQQPTRNVRSDQSTTVTSTSAYSAHWSKAGNSSGQGINQASGTTEHNQAKKGTSAEQSTPKNKSKAANKKKQKKEKGKGKEKTREDSEKATVASLEDDILSQNGKSKRGTTERPPRTEKPDKAQKKNKASKKSKPPKEGNHVSSPEMEALIDRKENASKPSETELAKKRSLERFLSYFEKRRRLIVVTAPSEQNSMYRQQRDEYREHVCEMALRKVSVVTIFGPLANGTMKIHHYQTAHDKPMRGLQDDDLVNHDLIMAFRKELGMTHDDFSMVLTDFEIKVKQQYEVPIAMKAVFDYMDTFTSRIKEMEQKKEKGLTCKKEDKSRTLENFLSRFRWRRRLFVISSPNEDEWAYQRQLHTLTSQACSLGLRHMSVLRLVGKDGESTGGVLELYPINGSASVEREHLSASLVQDIRNYFQVAQDSFSMLLVGKDGNVKSWYSSPMWSMAAIYDLVDSMQLRRQEMAIQLSLGMRCPEDEDQPSSHQDGHQQDAIFRGYGY